MKQIFKAVNNAVQFAWAKANLAFLALIGMTVSGAAMALDAENLRTNTAGTKNFGTVAGNLDTASQMGASLLIQLVSVGGFVVVALSLFQLWKASKDEREKPMSAIVGLFIGGAMAAVGTIMWIMRNTVIGTT